MSPITANASTHPDAAPWKSAELVLLSAFLERWGMANVGIGAAAVLVDAFGGLAGVAAADDAALARAGLSSMAIVELGRVRALFPG